MNKTQLILSVFLLGAYGCTQTAKNNNSEEFTSEEYSPRYADGFRILSDSKDSTKLAIEVYRPDTMIMEIPQGGYKSILCMSSTYVGALAELGKDSLVVAVSNRDYIVKESAKERAAEVGYEGAMNYEAVLASKPDIALIYGINGRSPIEEKLKELSIQYLYVNDFNEQHPLGRAEWMVALGYLTNTDGINKFAAIENEYQPEVGNTSVMINAPYSGSWFIPGNENYMSTLIRDAGGILAVKQQDGAGSYTIDLEEALHALSSAQIWLNPGQVNSLAEAQCLVPKAKFSAQVWNQTPDFYESGASRPDLVLNELKQIINGAATDTLRYFKRLI